MIMQRPILMRLINLIFPEHVDSIVKVIFAHSPNLLAKHRLYLHVRL